jgi:hypothetical protein
MDALYALNRGALAPQPALDMLLSVIRENLERFGVPANIQNAGQIANMVRAHLLPNDAWSRVVLRQMEQGKRPDFSAMPAEPHAIERGVAVTVYGIPNSRAADAPRVAAKVLHDLLESQGHLPRPEDVREY